MYTAANDKQVTVQIGLDLSVALGGRTRLVIIIMINLISPERRSCRGSMDKATDLHSANTGSTPAGTRISHWWQQEVYPAKITPVRQ